MKSFGSLVGLLFAHLPLTVFLVNFTLALWAAIATRRFLFIISHFSAKLYRKRQLFIHDQLAVICSTTTLSWFAVIYSICSLGLSFGTCRYLCVLGQYFSILRNSLLYLQTLIDHWFDWIVIIKIRLIKNFMKLHFHSVPFSQNYNLTKRHCAANRFAVPIANTIRARNER